MRLFCYTAVQHWKIFKCCRIFVTHADNAAVKLLHIIKKNDKVQVWKEEGFSFLQYHDIKTVLSA